MDTNAVAEELHEMRIHGMESIRSYGQNVIKGLFLLNGGSAIALLTLLGSLYGRSDQGSARLAAVILSNAGAALFSFGVGVVLTVIMSGVAYVNYVLFVRSIGTPWETRDQTLANLTLVERNRANVWVDRTMIFAVAVSVLPAFTFIYGGWRFQHALMLAAKVATLAAVSQ